MSTIPSTTEAPQPPAQLQHHTKIFTITTAKPQPVNSPITAKQMFFLGTVAGAVMCVGLMTGWTAVLPRLQQDTHTPFTLTDQEVAWMVSLPHLVIFCVAMVTGPLVEVLGPQFLLQVTLVLTAVSWLTMALTPSKWLMFVARAGVAIGVACISCTVQALLSEMSPLTYRGRICALPEMFNAFGMLLAFTVATFFSWNVATFLCALPVFLLISPFTFIPESPYWLVRRGRIQEALAALTRLRGRKEGVQEELNELLNAPSAMQSSITEQFMLLRKGRNLRPVVLMICLMVLRELGGSTSILQFSIYVFRGAGVDLDPFTCTVLLGAMRMVFVCIAAIILGHVGRKPLLVITALTCGIMQGITGLFLYLELSNTSWVPLVGLLLYVGVNSLGVATVPWILLGELVPSPVRSVGSSIIILAAKAAQFGTNFVFLLLVSELGLGITLLSFALCTLLVGVVAWQWVPETKGASLSQLQTAFSSDPQNTNNKGASLSQLQTAFSSDPQNTNNKTSPVILETKEEAENNEQKQIMEIKNGDQWHEKREASVTHL